ncbi:MAG: hypothetical protein ABL921_01015 [Pirellula sp.]
MLSADSVLFSSTGSLSVAGNGDVSIVANVDLVTGDGGDAIRLGDGSSISTDLGSIQLLADGNSGGNITLSRLATNSGSDLAIEIETAANIVDGTSAETENLVASNGTIVLRSSHGSISAGRGNPDIDIDSKNLTFDAPNGIVRISDLADGLRISGDSRAGGAGFIQAHSPLTISANIHLASSFVFTAGNSLDGDDNLTIDSGAIVTLTSATAQSLTFNAGDNIALHTGQVVANGTGNHQVFLNADLDGGADSVRGRISQDGTLQVEIQAHSLTATAADGIRLDTSVVSLTAVNSLANDIIIREATGITLESVVNAGGSIEINALGDMHANLVSANRLNNAQSDVLLLSSAGNIFVQSISAQDHVQIQAYGSIFDNDNPIDDIDVTGNDLILSADHGSIGNLSNNLFCALVETIEVAASSSLAATAINGAVALHAVLGGAFTVSADSLWLESDGDIDASTMAASVNSLALIADTDHDGNGVLTINNTLNVLLDLRLGGADIAATDGSIDLSAQRVMLVSAQAEILFVHDVSQLDVTTNGNVAIHSTSVSQPLELIDLSCDNIALQTLSSDGSIQIFSNSSIVVTDDVIAGNDANNTSVGSIELFANSVDGDIEITDLVMSDNGDIIIYAFDDVRVLSTTNASETMDNDNTSVISTIAGNIQLVADADSLQSGSSGQIFLADGSKVIAGRTPIDYVPNVDGLSSPSSFLLGTNIFPEFQAEIFLFADGDIRVSTLQTTNNDDFAILVATLNGGIIDSGDSATDANFVANSPNAVVTLFAVHGVGQSDPIETSVDRLYVVNTSGTSPLANPATGSIRIHEVSPGQDLTLLGMSNEALMGDALVQVAQGSLIVAGPVVSVGGNILLQAHRDLIVDEVVTSQTGHVSLVAQDDVLINANLATGGAGSIFASASNANTDATSGVRMESGTIISTAGGNVGVSADNEGDILLSRIDAGSGSVSLIAEGSILTHPGLPLVNIRAEQLRMVADAAPSNMSNGLGSIGRADLLNADALANRNAINTEVSILAAHSGGGIYVQELDSITIGSVGPIRVHEVLFSGPAGPAFSVHAEESISDLVSSSTGPVKLVSLAGTIHITDGADGDSTGIHSASDILVEARGSDSDVVTSAGLVSQQGHITVIAADSIVSGGSVETALSGTVYLDAQSGSVSISNIVAAGGGLLVRAGANVAIDADLRSTTEHIGVIAGIDILQSANLIAFSGCVVMDAGRDYSMQPNAFMLSSESVLAIANRNIVLGYVSALNVGLSAGGDIDDGNNAALNIAAFFSSLIAGGSIGGPSLASSPNANPNAIDTSVLFLAARSGLGIYVEEQNDVNIARVQRIDAQVEVARTNFRSDHTNLTDRRLVDALTDVTSGGPIKIVSQSGSIFVTDGFDGDGIGVESTGAGDILLEGRGANSSVVSSAGIVSRGGHIHLHAVDQVTLGAAVTTTMDGSILVEAQFGGILANARIETVDGSILVRASRDVVLNAMVRSNSGDVGFVSDIDVVQNAHVETSGGDVFISARGDYHMGFDTPVTAATNIVVTTGGSVILGLLTAENIGIDAGSDIVDGNDVATNISASRLVMRAGGWIGSAAPFQAENENSNAIDTHVEILAIRSGQGTYIEEASAILVDHVEAINVSVDVQRVHFRSDTSVLTEERRSDALDDVRSGGSIKLVTLGGGIRVLEGMISDGIGIESTGSGDVLLESRGFASDVILQADAISSGGHITLAAERNILTLGEVRTTDLGSIYLHARTGSIETARNVQTAVNDILLRAQGNINIESTIVSDAGNIGFISGNDILHNSSVFALLGDVLIEATRDFTMHSSADVVAQNNIVLLAGGKVTLAQFIATNVGIQSAGDILDGNNADLNVLASHLSLRSGGYIGGPSLASPTHENSEAIDTQVEFLAAASSQGTYVQEADGLAIEHVGQIIALVLAENVNFRSDTTAVFQQAIHGGLDDLTSGGPIKLITNSGSLHIMNGLDVDGPGIHATGDVLIEARGANGFVTTSAGIVSLEGHISILASDQVAIDGLVQTLASGSIFVESPSCIIGPDGEVRSSNGDIFVRSSADIEIDGLITSERGNIGILAANDVIQSSSIHTESGSVFVYASGDYSMMPDSQIFAFQNVLASAGKSILLGHVIARNVGLEAGFDILDGNGSIINVAAVNLMMRAGGHIGNPSLSSEPHLNPNAIDTAVDNLSVMSGQNGYVEEADNITIGHVAQLDASVGVEQVHFRSDTVQVLENRSVATLDDATVGGSFKLIAMGSIHVTDGADGDGVGIESTGNGNVLLESRTADHDIRIEATIASQGGHINLIAARNILVNDEVATQSTGTIFLNAVAGETRVADVIRTSDGDILLRAFANLSIDATVTSVHGNIGLITGGDLMQSANVETTSGDVLIRAGGEYTMTPGVQLIASGHISATVGGSILLESIHANSVSLIAGNDIVDSNGVMLNVVSSSLSMRAGGLIGGPSPTSGLGENPNAIDLAVDTLASHSGRGTYIEELDAIAIDVASLGAEVSVEQVNFRSDSIAIVEQDNVITDGMISGGPIKLVARNGSIDIRGETGIQSSSSGNILLEANGIGSNIRTTSNISSQGGHISLIAANHIALGGNVNTNSVGSVFIESTAGSIQNTGSIQSITGDILLRSGKDVLMDGLIFSLRGDVGLVANHDVIQSSYLVTAFGNVFVEAGGDYKMLPLATISALENIVATANGTIELGYLTAGNVSLNAGGDILDSNGADLNVVATNLSMRSGGVIGQSSLLSPPDDNPNAIDTSVSTLAATSVQAIYVSETDDIRVASVSQIDLSVTVQKVHFRSDSATIELSSTVDELSDLTSNGSVKLVSRSGSVLLTDGIDADHTAIESLRAGDVLVAAYGSGSDVIANAIITSHGGNISLLAGDSIVVLARVHTDSDGTISMDALTGNLNIVDLVSTLNGSILLRAARDTIVDAMLSSASGSIGLIVGRDLIQSDTISTTLGDVLIDAGRDLLMTPGSNVSAFQAITVHSGRNINLSSLSAQSIGLLAGGSIVDGNGPLLNIVAESLSMRAGGWIGGSALAEPLNSNPNAIDTAVDVVSAFSRLGTYVEEQDSITIGHTDRVDVAVSIERVNFRSDTTLTIAQRFVDAMDDFRGDQQLKLVTLNGNIIVEDGTDGNQTGVESRGAGNVLLEARGVGYDILTSAAIQSDGGHISLIASNSVSLGGSVQTSNSGSIILHAKAGVLDTHGEIHSERGDVLLLAQSNIIIGASISCTANIGIVAGGNVLQQANMETDLGDVAIDAYGNLTMFSGTSTAARDAIVIHVGQTITLGTLAADRVGLRSGADILDGNGSQSNVTASQLSMRAGGFIGGSSLASPAHLNPNAIDTSVGVLSAQSALGMYIEESNSVFIGQVERIETHINAEQVNFRSDTALVAISRESSALSDLRSNRQVKLVALDGSIEWNDGLDSDGIAIESLGSYDVLVETRGVGSNIIANATVQSHGGHVSLVASGSILLQGSVRSIAGGTILIDALAGTIDVREVVQSENGDIFLQSAGNQTFEANIRSAAGDIGLSSASSIVQIGNVETVSGSVFVAVGGNYTMHFDTSVRAMNCIVVNAGGTVTLGSLAAHSVGIATGADIIDVNGVQVNIAAANLSMQAAGSIGGPSLLSPANANPAAIDTAVDTLAVLSGRGIYVEESDSIAIGHVDETQTTVTIEQVNFRSDTRLLTQSRTTSAIDDLTSGGPIKLVAMSGSIVVNDGNDGDSVGVDSTSNFDILLDARGVGSDLIINATIQSQGGIINLVANDSVTLSAMVKNHVSGPIQLRSVFGTIVVRGSIESFAGDVSLQASSDVFVDAPIRSELGDIGVSGENVLLNHNIRATAGNVLVVADRDVLMDAGSVIAARQNIVVEAGLSIILGTLNATNVGLLSGSNILDGNADLNNIAAIQVNMRAGGYIGLPSLSSPVGENPNAIDTQVDVLAARSSQGVYIQESDALIIGHVDDIGVTVNVPIVYFRSDRFDLSYGQVASETLGIMSQGPIKVVTDNGSINVHEDIFCGNGNILLEARGSHRDLTTFAKVQSVGGHISLISTGSMNVSGELQSSENGTMLLESLAGSITLQGPIHLDDNLLIRSFGDLTTFATIDTAGRIAMIAGNDLLQSGDIRTTRGDILAVAGNDWVMQSDTSLHALTNIVARVGHSMELGSLTAASVGLRAGQNIFDGNGTSVNVSAINLSLSAGGFIGGPSAISSADSNPNAIDTIVTTLATLSGSGTYVQESDRIIVGHVDQIEAGTLVQRVNFRSDVSAVSIERSMAPLDDMTSQGPNKLMANGPIRVTDGNDGDGIGIESTGAGDILVEARGIASDIASSAAISSRGGHISLFADESVYFEKSVHTNSSGSIYLSSQNSDVAIGGPVQTTDGDILIEAFRDIVIDAQITSMSGDVGARASNDILQNADVDTRFGNVLFTAARDVTVHSAVNLEAFDTLLVSAGRTITLGRVAATNVGLVAQFSIFDGNDSLLNLHNVEANHLSMVAVQGYIGGPSLFPIDGPDVNLQAIDTSVSTLAAFGELGIYVQEEDGIAIDYVDAMRVSVLVQRANFRSDLAATPFDFDLLGAREDLTSNHAIKLVTNSGDIVVNDGRDGDLLGLQSFGNGDILLEARGGNDVRLNSSIVSQGGHVTLDASDDISINATVFTTGHGTVYVKASNSNRLDAIGGIEMGAESLIATIGGNVFVDSRGDIYLALINAGNGNNNASLRASNSILNANGSLNVIADELSITAIGGTIGNTADAIETSVSVLAAKSHSGIYLVEWDGVTIDRVGVITVQRSNFESTLSRIVAEGLEDLETAQGDIHLTNLTGDFIVQPGLNAAYGIRANNGNVIFESIGLAGDIFIGSSIHAGMNVTLTAVLGAIEELSASASVVGQKLTIDAGLYAHLHRTQVNSLDARVGSNGQLDSDWQTVNEAASQRGDDFLTEASHRSENETKSFLEQHTDPTLGDPINTRDYRFADKYEGRYALYLKNDGSLEIQSVQAGASASPNVYIETIGEHADLTVVDQVITASNRFEFKSGSSVANPIEGGIILVAGGEFVLGSSAILETRMELMGAFITQQINHIGDGVRLLNGEEDDRYLTGRFYDGGQGIEVDSPTMTSSRIVVPLYPQTSGADLDFETHVFQRVVIQFGTPNESGFVTFIGYADSLYQVFDVAGEVGSRIPEMSNQPISSHPSASSTLAAVFVRGTEFTTNFLTDNQYLPTDAIVRRAADFFLFENAHSSDSSEMRDLTFETVPILDVISRGDLGGSPLPPDLAPYQPPDVTVFSLPIPSEVPNLIKATDIELVSIMEPTRSIAAFRVIYNDIDLDGQPDPLELPSADEVLEQIGSQDSQTNAPLGQRLERLKDAPKTVDGNSPTPSDIEAFKAQLRSDPETPAGAYAIIEIQGESQSEVLDVFEVRDFDENKSNSDSELPLIPRKRDSAPKDEPVDDPNHEADNAVWMPDRFNNDLLNSETGSMGTKLAATGMLFGSYWIVRNTTHASSGWSTNELSSLSEAGLSASDRRRRRLRSSLEEKRDTR